MLPRLAFIILVGLCTPAVSSASTTVDVAGTCLTDNTSGKDRKVLMKWVFLAISKHPEIADLAESDAEVIEQSNRDVGALYTRLIADDCPAEIGAMIKEHGVSAISQPFEVLGQVAMQELMVNPNVLAHFSALDKYTDAQKLKRADAGEVSR